jgi:pilus assembly protein CpaB
MSSTLRLAIITVLLLSTTALGLIAYRSMNQPVPQASPETTPAPFTAVPSRGYFVATKPLRVGTLAKEDDFKFTPLTPGKDPPSEAILEAPDAIARLRGSLVRRFLDTDSPVTSKNIVRPHDRGFLASVLEAGKRAISIEVDAESGVSRLIWPGDHVDVVLTQEIDKDKPLSTMSETILQNVRIIAIDQEIEQGQSAPANNATANNAAPPKPPKHPVSLELKPEEVQKIAVAKKLGTLSLAIRPDESLNAPVRAGTEARAGAQARLSPVEQQDTGDTPRTTKSYDVSPAIARRTHLEIARAIARENATVTIYGGGKVTKYLVKKTNDPVTSRPPWEEAPMGPPTVRSVRIPVDVDGHHP